MTPRTPSEVGDLVRQRRLALRLTQQNIPDVSSATIRKIENGSEPNPRPATVLALTEAFGWPVDALDRLAAGEDPRAFTIGQMQAASGIDVPADLTEEELVEVARFARYLRDQRPR